MVGSVAMLALSIFLIYLAGKLGKEYADENKDLPEEHKDIAARNNKNLVLVRMLCLPIACPGCYHLYEDCTCLADVHLIPTP